MNYIKQQNTRKGFIIVVTLVLTLVMTTMGIGLYYSSIQAAKEVNSNTDKRTYLFSAESCITEAINWLEKNNTRCSVGSICHTISTNKGMGKWDIGEDTKRKKQMESQGYKCEIQKIKVKALNAGGEGFNVGQDDNYESETTINKHYFKINSNGFNVGGNDKTSLETIVSIIY
jgi:Tfp pilus assembly protein PilX